MLIGNVMRGLCELKLDNNWITFFLFSFLFFFGWSSVVPEYVELAKH